MELQSTQESKQADNWIIGGKEVSILEVSNAGEILLEINNGEKYITINKIPGKTPEQTVQLLYMKGRLEKHVS